MSRKSERKRSEEESTRKRRQARLASTAFVLALLAVLMLFMWFTILRHDAKSLIGEALPDVPYLNLSAAHHRLGEHRDGPFLVVVVRTQCAPCEAFLEDLRNRISGEAASERTLALFLEHPEPDRMETVKLRNYPFSVGFVRVLRDAAPLQVIVVPTVFLAVDGRVEAVEYGIPERLNSVVANFMGRFQ